MDEENAYNDPINEFSFAMKVMAPLMLLTTILIFIFFRRFAERFDDPGFNESQLTSTPLHAIQMTRFDIPFTVNIKDLNSVEVTSSSENWTVHSYSFIDIETVMVHLLKQNTPDSEFYESLDQLQCTSYTNKSYDSPGIHSMTLDKDTTQEPAEARQSYPLMVVATDEKDTLVCLLHTGDTLLPSPYIIAQFYRDISGIFRRLTPMYANPGGNEECCICLVNTCTCVLLPCRHRSTCEQCLQRLAFCPICRSTIGSYFSTVTDEESHSAADMLMT